MKLKQRPTVYYRIDLLCKYSKKFAERVHELHVKMEEKTMEDKEIIKMLVKEFCVLDGIEDPEARKDARFELHCIVDTDMKEYETFQYRGNDVHSSPSLDLFYREDKQIVVIEIKAPITKALLLKHWWRIAEEQKNFLFSPEGNFGHLGEALKHAVKMGSPDAKEHAKFRRKRKIGEELTDEELEKIALISQRLMTRDIFKDVPKKKLDEDILILRLARDYGDKATDEYGRLKLISWLKKKGVKVEELDEEGGRKSFASLLSDHMTPDLKRVLDTFPQTSNEKIKQRIGALDFDRRLLRARAAFSVTN